MSIATTRTFRDRHEAGRMLAERLAPLATQDPVVLGLARGGVPVAYEVAQVLNAPLDVLVVRKIGAPANPEFGIGAIAEGGILVLNDDAVLRLLVSHDELEAAIARERAELQARVARYRGDRPPADVEGRTVIIVDDGLATGGTARAALRAIRARHPRRLVLGVPVGAPTTVDALRDEADEIVCLLEPGELWAVGAWYDDFRPTHDAEVQHLLDGRRADPPTSPPPRAQVVQVPLGEGAAIAGDLALPEAARALVIFAHGSGSSRHSPRNRQVAAALNEHGLATVLLDLLTSQEALDRANVFDVELLGRRLVAATRWAQAEPALASLPIAYFGASTGAAAALRAAAELGDAIAAVVSRGGRPDLAAPWLSMVRAPVLLIVGGADDVVLGLNRRALRALRAPSQLEVVAGATHLFEEPGALEQVAELAAAWVARHVSGLSPRS